MTLSPQLLAALRGAGLGVSQHRYTPQPDEWFAGGVDAAGHSHGDVGPWPSAEEALVGGVAWLVRTLETAEQERYAVTEQLQNVREELEAVKRALAACQAELRAEREAKG